MVTMSSSFPSLHRLYRHLQDYQMIILTPSRKNTIISASQRNYSSFLLCCTVGFLFADQNLLAPNLSIIATEFNFNDIERDEKLGGNISFGFFVVRCYIHICIYSLIYLHTKYQYCKHTYMYKI